MSELRWRLVDVVIGAYALTVIAVLTPFEHWRMRGVLIEDGPAQGYGHPWAWLSMRAFEE